MARPFLQRQQSGLLGQGRGSMKGNEGFRGAAVPPPSLSSSPASPPASPPVSPTLTVTRRKDFERPWCLIHPNIFSTADCLFKIHMISFTASTLRMCLPARPPPPPPPPPPPLFDCPPPPSPPPPPAVKNDGSAVS